MNSDTNAKDRIHNPEAPVRKELIYWCTAVLFELFVIAYLIGFWPIILFGLILIGPCRAALTKWQEKSKPEKALQESDGE